MATRRRSHHEGSIYQRTDGRWVAAVTPPSGLKVYRYAKTRELAAHKLTALLKALDDGLPAISERRTVASFAGEFLEAIQPTIRPSTYRRYEQLVRVHILPLLGKIPLTRLMPGHVIRLHATVHEAGRKPQTVVLVHRLLRQILDRAMEWGYVNRNVAGLVKAPAVGHIEMQVLDVDQVRRLLDTARETRLEALWHIALGTGLRSGELLALRWTDFDSDAGTLRVRATLTRNGSGWTLAEPKTARSRRVVGLSPKIVAQLEAHQRRQIVERLKCGPAWQDHDFVFCTPIGTPLDGTNLLRRDFRPLLPLAGVSETLRVHDLRHTALSLALSRGVAPVDVSALAGHASVATTLDRYAHALPGAPRRAASAIAEAISGA